MECVYGSTVWRNAKRISIECNDCWREHGFNIRRHWVYCYSYHVDSKQNSMFMAIFLHQFMGQQLLSMIIIYIPVMGPQDMTCHCDSNNRTGSVPVSSTVSNHTRNNGDKRNSNEAAVPDKTRVAASEPGMGCSCSLGNNNENDISKKFRGSDIWPR